MTKNDLTENIPAIQYDLVSVSVRMYRAHLDLIDRAVVLRAAKHPGFDRSDYIRETMALQASIDLGVELPHMPEIVRGRGGSLVDQAAAQLGMSRAEFEQNAIRAMAAQALAADVYGPELTPRRPESGTYKRASVRPEALGPQRKSTVPPPSRKRSVG